MTPSSPSGHTAPSFKSPDCEVLRYSRYSTVLVRARTPANKDDLSNPGVDLVVTRGRHRQTRPPASSSAPRRSVPQPEAEYHSDRCFSSHFLHTSPKLEDMLHRTEK